MKVQSIEYDLSTYVFIYHEKEKLNLRSLEQKTMNPLLFSQLGIPECESNPLL